MSFDHGPRVSKLSSTDFIRHAAEASERKGGSWARATIQDGGIVIHCEGALPLPLASSFFGWNGGVARLITVNG